MRPKICGMIDALQPLQPATTGRDKLALRLLQLGAIAVVLAATTYKAFELDRYFVPKELALHLTALLSGLLLAKSFRESERDRIDLLLLGFLVVSAASAVFATNYWLALRSLSVSASGIVVFWAARTLQQRGHARPLLTAVALAVIAGVITSLLQTYGVQTELFSINRAPGGTLGNRNFVAHLAAFGFPVVLIGALQARNSSGYFIRALGVITVLAVLVLTRSRAAWLAFAAVAAIFLLAMIVSRPLRTSGRTWLRLAGIVVLAVIGVTAAVYTPNKLRWRGDNPYLSSMKGVANYQEGSGRGRLIQYRRSVKMGLEHAMLGVGPGNWSVRYPRVAARRDPSLDGNEPGTTSNPWPSSDWVAFIAERGFVATALLGLAWLVMAGRGLRRLFYAPDDADALRATALVATLAATFIAGAFDAVLLLALPTLLVWATLGALLPARMNAVHEPRRARRSMIVIVALIAGIGALRSSAQLFGMGVYATTQNASALHRASLIDPGNYPLHLRLARPGSGLKRSTRCKHAEAAHGLYPSAAAARSLANGCD